MSELIAWVQIFKGLKHSFCQNNNFFCTTRSVKITKIPAGHQTKAGKSTAAKLSNGQQAL
jgi:hypothetical protein